MMGFMRTIRHETIRPWDYLPPWNDTDPAVSALVDLHFEQCRVLGPAILYLGEGAFISGITNIVGRQGSKKSDIIWEATEQRAIIVGAIVVRDTTFASCTFEEIGFSMHTNQVPSFWAALGY